MSDGFCYNNTEFDEFAAEYDAALEKGISVSGESKDYFARARVSWLAECLSNVGYRPRTAMDFGCGTGTSIPYLLDLIGVESVVGVDTSQKCLASATRNYQSPKTQFLLFDSWEPKAEIDLAFCNGVFHHIPPMQRPAAIDYVNRSLRSGGLFALWDNNPWSPGARYVMSRIPFDRDASMLSASESRGLLRAGGFEVLRTDYLFVFPRVLSWLRWVERGIIKLPFGAQYEILCRKL